MLLAIALTQLGSITHATWNLAAAKVAGGGRTFVWVYSVLAMAWMLPVAGIQLAIGVEWRWVYLPAGLVSGLLHGLYALALQRAYVDSDLNVAYPVGRGLAPLMVAIIAVVLLGERLRSGGWLGVLLIVAGVAIVSAGKLGEGDRARQLAGLRMGVLVALCTTGYTLWDDYAVGHLRLDPLLYNSGNVVVVGLLLTLGCWSRRRQGIEMLRAHPGPVIAVAILMPVSYLLVLFAMTMAPVSVVAPLRSTSIVLGSLAAWLIVKEPGGPRRVVGALVVLVGVLALAWFA